ncbi:MAG TPA: ribonuclease HII, partial [Bacillota bacterium]|nr:ribonuclease HII [Bacillota bacterium]
MKKALLDEALEKERQSLMGRFETELYQDGYRKVAGVDEAGRGPLAGPVVAAAIILPRGFFVAGLNDSKQVSPKLRETIFSQLMAANLPYAVGFGTVAEIDTLNILGATRLAMKRAIEGLPIQPDYILIDALTLQAIAIPQKGIIHGDALSLSIAAASIIAKVTRDRMMVELDQAYPGYGLAKHKGYPTAEHYRALAKLGPSPIHRQSFRLTADTQEPLFEGETGG